MGEEVAVTSCHLHLERIIHGKKKEKKKPRKRS